MTLPNQFLLSDLLKHRVRCDQGMDHGIGLTGWMHPPVHRLLGWFSKPSTINLTRRVWKLDQLRGIGEQEVYVKGLPAESEQSTIDRIPTLLNSDVLNLNGERLASVVDLVFQPKTGQIIHYLLSRSDPRIPGTSRWRLLIEHILDQQPGMISIGLNSLDDLPLSRSSIKQKIIRSSRNWRDHFQDFSDQAGNRLEGWIEEAPWEETINRQRRRIPGCDGSPLENRDNRIQNEELNDVLESSDDFVYRERQLKIHQEDDDPWI